MLTQKLKNKWLAEAKVKEQKTAAIAAKNAELAAEAKAKRDAERAEKEVQPEAPAVVEEAPETESAES
jgi:small subunit ribosomal protein S16